MMWASEHGRSGMRRGWIGVALFSGVINILGFTGPLFMLEVYDRVIPSSSVQTLAALLILVAGLYISSGFFEVLRGRVLSKLAGLIDSARSEDVINAIAASPFRTRSTGDILKPAQELDQIRSYLSGLGPAALFDLPWLPVYLAASFFIHPLIGWLAASAMITLIALTGLTDVLVRTKIKDAARAGSARNRLVEAVYKNAESISSMGMLPDVRLRWHKAHNQYVKIQRDCTDVAMLLSNATKTLRQAIQSGSLALGSYLVLTGDMSGGMIIAASIIVGRALQPVEQVIGHWRSMVSARQAWARLNEIAKMTPGKSERTALPPPSIELMVDKIFVSPPGERQKVVVNNVSFQVKAGMVLGVFGPSASGKSSLLRAITGVWPLPRGKVSFDGANIEQWPEHTRGRHVGYMPQSPDLFPGTIAENIARLNLATDDQSIVIAAQQAGVHDMIVGLPDGYETQVGDGGNNLSAGQKQRIALARALYRDPFLVVLDEPNSSLDANGDKALADAISSVKAREGIVIIVSHRPSILSHIDLMLVMENGVAKAFGSRDEMLKAAKLQSTHPVPSAAYPHGPSI